MAKSATAASVPHTAIVSDLRKVFNEPDLLARAREIVQADPDPKGYPP
jgi:hypothetical protein